MLNQQVNTRMIRISRNTFTKKVYISTNCFRRRRASSMTISYFGVVVTYQPHTQQKERKPLDFRLPYGHRDCQITQIEIL